MMGVFAEFEQAMIRERVNAGLARARAKGKVLGRPKVKRAVEKRIRELRAKGMGMLAIGRLLKVGTATVQRVLCWPRSDDGGLLLSNLSAFQ
jgi:DNA invertase Pin-like site-specific DNA recombinase